MRAIERAVEAYRRLVADLFAPYSGTLLVLGGLVTVLLSYLLFYRCREPGARRRAAAALSALTALSALVAAYELWYWGEVTYAATITIVPIALMDALAAVRFRFDPKGVARAFLFVVFLAAALLFVASTIFGELFPINRLVGSGLLAD